MQKLLFAFAVLSLLHLACDDSKSVMNNDKKEMPKAGLAGQKEAPKETPKEVRKGNPNFADLAGETVVARVQNIELTRADVERTMVHRAAQLSANLSALPKEAKEALLYASYDSSIRRVLVFEEAKRLNMRATEKEVDDQLARLKKSIPKGRTFAEVLEKMKVDEAKLKLDLATDIAISKLQKKRAKEIKKPSLEGLKARYQKDLELLRPPPRAKVKEILVALAPDAKEDAVNEAKKKIEAIYKEVKDKDAKTFAKVAAQKSEAKETKKKGGQVEPFTRRGKVPDYGTVAFSLEKGKVSRIFRTEAGFFILFGEGIMTNEPVPFEKAKPALEKRMLTEARQAADKAFIAGLTEKATIVRIEEPQKPLPPKPPSMAPATPKHAAATSRPASAPSGPSGHGADMFKNPIPSKDNVLPGAPNPHASKELKLDPNAKPDHGLRVRGAVSQPGK